MDAKTILGVSVLLLATSLAGCTGDFEIQQTDPIRVQMEGQPEKVQVKDDDPEPQRVIVENPAHVESVDVEVKVTKTSSGPVTILVIIEDSETGERLAEKEIRVGDDFGNETTDPGNETTEPGNETSPPPGNETEPGFGDDSSQTVVIQNIYVDVKGKDNFVVLAQSLEGDADVDIGASASSEEGDMDGFDGNETWDDGY